MQQPAHGDRQPWERIYQEKEIEEMGWYYPDLDPDLEKTLQDMNITSGYFLDLGTGAGTHAIALAKMAFKVTATDISANAIDIARAKSRQQEVDIDFRQDDILDTRLDSGFDCIFDRGCFHALLAEQRDDYARIVYHLLKFGGFLFVKCYSHKQEGSQGPRDAQSPNPLPPANRFSPEQIEGYFVSCFTIVSIGETVFHRTKEPLPKALFCVMKKRDAIQRGIPENRT